MFVVKLVRIHRKFLFFIDFFFFFLLKDYLDEALALSAKYRRHDKYIKIQIENKKDYDKALTYIQTLKFDDALQAFRNYGKTLIKEQPKLTTKLLKQLNPTPQQIEQEQLPESLINLFMNNPDELLDYLEYAVKVYFTILLIVILYFLFYSNIRKSIWLKQFMIQF
jgi:predicted Zn-dependent protease